MIQIAVCDDENAVINQIESLLVSVCDKEGMRADIDVFLQHTGKRSPFGNAI